MSESAWDLVHAPAATVPASPARWIWPAFAAATVTARHPPTIAATTSSSPNISPEGLVADTRFLDNIRERRNLINVLHEYGVDCHVATNPAQHGKCWRVQKPPKAGPSWRQMAADI
jgi:hypothetical protein